MSYRGDLIAHNDDLRGIQSPTEEMRFDNYLTAAQKSDRISHNDLLDEEEQRLQEQINKLHLEENNKLRGMALNQPTNQQLENMEQEINDFVNYSSKNMNNQKAETSDQKLYDKIYQ